MNNPNNLFSMMQTGGMTSTAGGAALARALQRQSDIKKLERQARSEARRQKRGSFLGSLGSLAGGLLGSIIPGVGTAIGAGLGSALGKRVGEGLGAGRTEQYDTSGTVFGQQDFRDIQRASRDYTRGMGERALVSGLRAALTAGLSKDGGIYGSKNPLREGSKFRQTLSDINEYGLTRTTGIGGNRFASEVTKQGLVDNPFLAEQFDDVFDVVDGVPIDIEGNPVNIMGSLSKSVPSNVLIEPELLPMTKSTQSFFNNEMIQDVNKPSLPVSNFLGKTVGKTKDFLGELKNLGLARMYGIGGKNFAENVRNQALLDNASLLMGQDIDEFAFLDDVQEQPSMQASLLGLQDKVNQYNNLLSFQNGGYTASGVLQQAGLDPTEDQLKLFQQFDPTQIQQAKTGAEQSLLSMTGGMGLSSAGGGFGARQRAATSAIGAGQDLIGDTTEQAQRAFESQTLGTAADLMAGGAEFGNNNSGSFNYPRVEQMPMVNLGHSINYNGQNYVWSEEEGAYILET